MEKLNKTVEFLNSKTNNFTPEIGIILGSGLGCFSEDLEGISIPYSKIPNFPKSISKTNVEGHKGELLFVRIHNKDCVIMQGRFHFYEGYSMSDIVYPIQVLKELGVKTLFITNAAGATSKNYNVGDIMMVEDHINLMGTNPLIRPYDSKGDRFPDMSEIYSKRLHNLALNCACDINVDLIKGVYLATTGPNYETKAEVKAFKALGADAVGMSSVPEAIEANYLKMEIITFSLITNRATGISENKLSHQEVLDIGKTSGLNLSKLIKRMIYKL